MDPSEAAEEIPKQEPPLQVVEADNETAAKILSAQASKASVASIQIEKAAVQPVPETPAVEKSAAEQPEVLRKSETPAVEKSADEKPTNKGAIPKKGAQKSTPPKDKKADTPKKNEKASPKKGRMSAKAAVKPKEPEPPATVAAPKQQKARTVRKYIDSGEEEGEYEEYTVYEDEVDDPKIETDDSEVKQTKPNKEKTRKSQEKQKAAKGGKKSPRPSKSSTKQSKPARAPKGSQGTKIDPPVAVPTPSKMYLTSPSTMEMPQVVDHKTESENESEPSEVYEVEEEATSATLEPKDAASIDVNQFQEDEDSIWSDEPAVSYPMEAESFLRQEPLEAEPDFFVELGEIPSLSDIDFSSEEDEEVEADLRSLSRAVSSVQIDVGSFRDPLTGELIEDEETKQLMLAKKKKQKEEREAREAKEKEKEKTASEEEDEVVIFDLDEDPDLFFPPEEEFYDTTKRSLVEQFDLWMELETQKQVKIDDEYDNEKATKEEQLKQLERMTKQFIDTLIGRAVLMSEYTDPKELLRQNLDKTKLMNEIIEKSKQIQLEKNVLGFLNRKVVDYYRRKKLFRQLKDEFPALAEINKRKFREALHVLDKLLEKEEDTRLYIEEEKVALEEQLVEAEALHAAELEKFETFVYNTLKRDNAEAYNESVKKHLKDLHRLRLKVSEMRELLINRQHALATLVERQEALEDLGNGLKMRDYERLQTETATLDKKIEERNLELNKLRWAVSGNLNTISHCQEKQSMLALTESLKKEAFELLTAKEASLRQQLISLKIERGEIRKKIQELSYQGGLVDKEALMHDFDATTEAVERTRANVLSLHLKCEEIEARLLMMDEMEASGTNRSLQSKSISASISSEREK